MMKKLLILLFATTALYAGNVPPSAFSVAGAMYADAKRKEEEQRKKEQENPTVHDNYTRFRDKTRSWGPINGLNTRLIKPTQEEFSALEERAWKERDIDVILHLKATGARTSWHHHPLAEAVKLVPNFVWNNKAIVAWSILLMGAFYGAGQKTGAENAAKNSVCRVRCMDDQSTGMRSPEGVGCHDPKRHVHIITHAVLNNKQYIDATPGS